MCGKEFAASVIIAIDSRTLNSHGLGSSLNMTIQAVENPWKLHGRGKLTLYVTFLDFHRNNDVYLGKRPFFSHQVVASKTGIQMVGSIVSVQSA